MPSLCRILMLVSAAAAASHCAASPGTAGGPADAARAPARGKAPPLPAPAGKVVEVKTVEELFRAAGAAAPGSTISIADGTYHLPGLLRLRGLKDVAVRGASGDRDKVTLDGARSGVKEMVWLEACEGVTLADLTIQNALVHGVTIKGESNVQRPLLHNLHLKNCWERAIKGTAPAGRDGKLASVPEPEVLKTRPAGGRIEYCLIENEHPKRENDWTGGDYLGGIDMMWLKDWVVSDNTFLGLKGKNAQARAAIFIWNNSEDVVVERNLVAGCDTGIAFGNPSGGARHMTRGILRNNFIVRGSYKAIELARTADCQVYHNTIWSEDAGWGRTFHVFQGAGGSRLHGNLVRGKILLEDPDCRLQDNVTGELEGWFLNPRAGDLHLSPAGRTALERKTLPVQKDFGDFEADPRGGSAFPGADQPRP